MTMSRTLRLAPFAAVALLAGCAAPAPKPTPPTVAIPGSLDVPGKQERVPYTAQYTQYTQYALAS